MKTRTVLLIAAAVLVALGCIVFVLVMNSVGWDFGALNSARYETRVYEISDGFVGVEIEDDTADIRILPSEDGKCRIELRENEKMPHSAAVEGDTLKVSYQDLRQWYDHIGIFGSSKIDLYLPVGQYAALKINTHTSDVTIDAGVSFETVSLALSTGDVCLRASASGTVQINTSTGDIDVESITAGALLLSTSTGRISAKSVVCNGDVRADVDTGRAKLQDVKCKSFFTNGDTGDLILRDLVAEERFEIERDTGDVRMEGCDASEIFIKTGTGDVRGTLLSEKTFIVKADTGEVEVPDGTVGGRCEIETGTGDVKIRLS